MIGYPGGQNGAILPARECPFCSCNKISLKSKRVHESSLSEHIFRDSNVFMDLDFVSVHKDAKRELGQYPAILTDLASSTIHTHTHTHTCVCVCVCIVYCCVCVCVCVCVYVCVFRTYFLTPYHNRLFYFI